MSTNNNNTTTYWYDGTIRPLSSIIIVDDSVQDGHVIPERLDGTKFNLQATSKGDPISNYDNGMNLNQFKFRVNSDNKDLFIEKIRKWSGNGSPTVDFDS